METGNAPQSAQNRSGSRTRSRIEDARALAPVCQQQKAGPSSEADPRNHRTSGSAVSWLRQCRASTDLSEDLDQVGAPPPPPPPGAPPPGGNRVSLPSESLHRVIPQSPARSSSESSFESASDAPPPPESPHSPPGPPGLPDFGLNSSAPPGPPGLPDFGLNSSVDRMFACPAPPPEAPPALPPTEAPPPLEKPPSMPLTGELEELEELEEVVPPPKQEPPSLPPAPAELPMAPNPSFDTQTSQSRQSSKCTVTSKSAMQQVSASSAPNSQRSQRQSIFQEKNNLSSRGCSKEKSNLSAAGYVQATSEPADPLSEALKALGVGKSKYDLLVDVTVRPEGVNAIITALQEGKIEQKLIAEVCNALENVVLRSESCLMAVIRAGGHLVLIRLMQQYSYYAEIQVSICQLLQHLVVTEPAVSEKVAKAGFFRAAVEAMRRFNADADVQSTIIPVVELIAFQCPDLRADAADAGLVEALIAAMKAHVADAEVQQTACAALQALIVPASGNSNKKCSVLSRAFDAGAVNVSVTGMNAHKSDQKIQYWFGLLLRDIANSSDTKMKSELISKLHWQGIQVAGL